MSFFARPSIDDLVIVLVATAVFFLPSLLDAGGESPADARQEATAAATGTPTASAEASTNGAGTPGAANVSRDVDACDFIDEIDRVRAATVRILVPLPGGTLATGSGFHLGDGLYVSAAHVVLDDLGQQAAEVFVQSADTGQEYPAVIESIGQMRASGWGRDLVLLRASAIPSAIDWRAPSEADVDREVRVLGYPWSLEDDGPTLPLAPVVRGTLAFLGSVEGIEIVQSSAKAEEGMSGGPLVDKCGTAVALVTGARFATNELGALREGFGVFVSMAEFERLP